jgi:hypothetical protein
MERKHIDINGISLTIVDQEFINKYKIIIEKCQYRLEPLENGIFVLLTDLTTKKLFTAAGYDLSKIDFAVPQNWLNQPDIHTRFYDKNDPAVWSYEKDPIFGSPVWSSEAMEEMMNNIRMTLMTLEKACS